MSDSTQSISASWPWNQRWILSTLARCLVLLSLGLLEPLACVAHCYLAVSFTHASQQEPKTAGFLLASAHAQTRVSASLWMCNLSRLDTQISDAPNEFPHFQTANVVTTTTLSTHPAIHTTPASLPQTGTPQPVHQFIAVAILAVGLVTLRLLTLRCRRSDWPSRSIPPLKRPP